MSKEKKEKSEGIIREINLGGLNANVHLMSTDAREDIIFLLEKGLAALQKVKDGEQK